MPTDYIESRMPALPTPKKVVKEGKEGKQEQPVDKALMAYWRTRITSVCAPANKPGESTRRRNEKVFMFRVLCYISD